LHKLPNKTIVRYVKVVGGRIYTGSYEEFGFWQRLNTGLLNYTSLSKNLTADIIDSQSIWDIYELGKKIVFKSFSTIYIYDDHLVTSIKPDFILISTLSINKFIYGKPQGIEQLSISDQTLNIQYVLF